jgi:hypothetical protein
LSPKKGSFNVYENLCIYQLQNGKHVVEYIKASKNMKKMKRRLYKSKLQNNMRKIKNNHFQELIKVKSA